MKFVCKDNRCTACMLCADICPRGAINIVDSTKYVNAEIDISKCINCGLCTRMCHVNNGPSFVEPFQWKQGWVNNEKQRSLSSSGGIATAIEIGFIRSGGVVCSCSYFNNHFSFIFVDKESDVCRLTGSKYVKSNPTGIYKKILEYIKNGKKVLFVGLPCQVAALKLYIGNKNDNLFTIDLICHGTPSEKIFHSYLSSLNLNKMKEISFRKNNFFQLSVDGRNIYSDGVRDEYIVGFLNCLFYTDNCYSCMYARKERISDITLGDSWGSDMSEEEIKKGISLIITQTSKGNLLLEMANISLFDVDDEHAVNSNKQLISASQKHERSDLFWRLLNKGYSVRNAVRICLPYTSSKQWIKSKIYYVKNFIK